MKKIGAGGRLQNYDSKGRYCKNNYFDFTPPVFTKKEIRRRKEEKRRQELYEKAKSSDNAYVFDVYLALEKAMPGAVIGVNEKLIDANIGRLREFDIITKKCIIEVKSKKASKSEKQLLAQLKYANLHNMKHFLYSPTIPRATKYQYEKKGIDVSTTLDELIRKLKERQ
jgi:hypothetical protein